jgi:hypothetical protein
VRKMSIGWNYVGKLTPMRSNISRFPGGTVQKTPEAARMAFRWAEKTGTGFTLPGHQQAAAEASNGKPGKLLQFRKVG